FRMATGFLDDPNTGQGVVLYNTGNGVKDFFDITSNAGQLPGGLHCWGPGETPPCGNSLLGAPDNSIYKGIALFQDRTTSVRHDHGLQGGGGLSITGTIYLTNTETSIRTNPAV